METKEKIIKCFKEKNIPLKSGEISELTGLDKKIVSKEINKLKNDGIIFSPKRCFYRIKQ